ncbi:MAG: heme exporter protein CcmB [Saprospiraceae bacterium]|nr:heme exporter protein CcmB [Saprospiraceae bacterium]
MKDLHFILVLLRKEFLLEFRTRSAISGIFLYVISTLFVVYETFVKIQHNVWNTLFWIILLFVAVNAMVKSFVQEKGNRVLYYYSLLNPSHVLIAKIVYNTLLLLVLSLLIWGLFIFFGDNPVKDIGLFLLILLLGSFGFSVTFTFLASLVAASNQSSTLLAVLSFPLIIPIILMLVKISAHALRLIQDTAVSGDLAILVAIDLLLCGVALLLFPFIWRD